MCVMGSTESGAGDFSVGSIVWVRRRNGSWWPGKIVGPEELSASHLTSPRSGTPVKLLGREDASVDWYNLEKSKRVKAFRCGEFDDCIEKAEASQGIPVKKREKYARREDAIIHALELEKQLLKKQGKLGITSERMNSKLSGAMKKELLISSESLGHDNGKLGNSKLHQLSKRLDMPHRNDSIASPMSSQRAKEGNQLSGEDDHCEVTPRIRVLQDFGLKIAPSKRKVISSAALNGSWKPTVDSAVQPLARSGLSKGGTSHVNGKHSSEQRKRPHEGLSDELLVKRPDKRRSLVQVLQNSAQLAVSQSLQPDSATVSTSVSGVEQTGVICKAKRSKCVYFPAEFGESLEYEAAPPNHIEVSASLVGAHHHADSLMEENTSGFTEEESDSSETDSSGSESDSSETEPDMDEEMALLSEPEMGRYEAQEHGILVAVEPDESMHSGDMSHLYSHDPSFTSEAVSKWQLKGKRNIRNLTKKSMDATDGKGYIYGPYSEEKNELTGLEDEYLSRAASRSRNSVGQNMIDWEDWTWEDRSAWNEHWDIKRERFQPVHDGHYPYRRRPRYLLDVDLKVQASYQKEPVPIVSLMSKLNGKAIIGHPIQIETLEDGSSNSLLSTVNELGEQAVDNNGGATLPHAWRTARRTANVRVPRPHLSSALDGDEAAGDLPLLDEESKPPFKKLNSGSFSNKASQGKRNRPHNSRTPSDRRFSKKAAKKVSLSSSQKTRTLSSIAIDHNLSNKPIHHQDSTSCQRDGVMKPESSSGPTTVACIPVKLVFSRLLEKINRPPLKAAASTVLLNSQKERIS